MSKLRLFLLLACAVVAILAAVVFYQFNQSGDGTGLDSQSHNTRFALPGAGAIKRLTNKQKLAATRQLVEEQIARAPEFAPFFDRLKKTFPAANQRILDGFADAVGKGNKLETPDYFPFQALSGLRSSHGILAASASQDILNRVYDLRAATLRALAANDPKLCADFLYGATSAAFFQFSSKNRALLAKMMEADLDAIIDGNAKKIERPGLESEEIAKLEAALREKKLEKPEIDMLLDARMPDPPLADATVCKAGLAYYEALHDLPEDLRMKIYAQSLKLLART